MQMWTKVAIFKVYIYVSVISIQQVCNNLSIHPSDYTTFQATSGFAEEFLSQLNLPKLN